MENEIFVKKIKKSQIFANYRPIRIRIENESLSNRMPKNRFGFGEFIHPPPAKSGEYSRE